ncbi:MAG: hypothetical protein HXX13_16215 [Bacteroidetes bacterium]|nr:hypothetical protein [Bacteroidota bacterium]
MNSKMTYGGIGPKLALITLPYVILSIIIMQRDPQFLFMNVPDSLWLKIPGLILLAGGLLFYMFTIVIFLADFKNGQLITRGPFALCRNPIYATFLVFIIPGLALFLQSGLTLSIDLVLYINFRISIHGENRVLERQFGQEYIAYRSRVNELIPVPRINK